MDHSPSNVLDADSFVEGLRECLMIECPALSLDSDLVDDAGIDSLQALLALEFVTDALGDEAAFSEEESKEVFAAKTVRDLYGLYLTKVSMPKGDCGDCQEHDEFPVKFGGRLVALRSVRSADMPILYGITNSDEIAWRWRYGGTIPSYEEFVRSFDQGVLTQFVVSERGADASAVGLVVAYGANLQHGIASVGAMVRSENQKRGMGAEAVVVFLRHLFNTWNIYKVYLETPEFNMSQFGSGVGRFYHLEGRLREHYYYCGRRWDQLIVGIYAEEFMKHWGMNAPGKLEGMRWIENGHSQNGQSGYE